MSPEEIVVTLMGGELLLKVNNNAIEEAFKIERNKGYNVNIVTNGGI